MGDRPMAEIAFDDIRRGDHVKFCMRDGRTPTCKATHQCVRGWNVRYRDPPGWDAIVTRQNFLSARRPRSKTDD